MGIKKVGVVGGGFMGSGIVQVCAQSGYEVVLVARREQSLNKGIATIEYYLSRDVEKGRISQQDKDLTRARIKGSLTQEDLNDRDLVIEAIPEDKVPKLYKIIHLFTSEIMIGGKKTRNRGSLKGKIRLSFEDTLKKFQKEDTITTFTASLAAFYNKIPAAH